MADFDDFDEETLDRLRKALLKAAETGTDREPWQEHFGRGQSTFSEEVLSNDIIQGLSGSWAASYQFGWGAGSTPLGFNEQKSNPNVPAPLRARSSHFGERGVPSLDFVPYNWRTNRFAIKGPSLVGHPISFEPVGPTLKTERTDWTWQIEAGVGPNGGDLLTQLDRPDGVAPAVISIEEMLNQSPWTMGGVGEPNGGMYLIISDPGEWDGSLDVGPAKLDPRPAYYDTARTEIFRIFSIQNNPGSGRAEIELHPNKPLTTFWDLPASPATRAIRAVAFFQPYVTRLAAIPESGAGVGRERVFQILSPEVAAASEYYPAFDGGTPSDGTWLQGGFPGHEPGWPVGTAATYGGNAKLPVPKPLRETFGNIEPLAPAAASITNVGTSIITAVDDVDVTDIGRIIRIYHVDSQDDVPFRTGDAAKILGWFEVIGIDTDVYTIRHVPDIDPATGVVFYGPVTHETVAGEGIFVYFTVHDAVETVWQGQFDTDKVKACRLENIIDPKLVERFGKKRLSGLSTARTVGNNPGTGDRAIFGTRTVPAVGGDPAQAEDPGNMLDLGFRMVFFPAKDDGAGNPIPDFDNPIDSRELVIDPAATGKQFLEEDYSSGLVTLSVAPPGSATGEVVPNGIIGGPGTTNERNEVVLFAACVPYSMEPQSNRPGVRVVVRNPAGNNEHVDVFSNRLTANVDQGSTAYIGGPPWFDEATGIVLTAPWTGPQTGIIDVLDGGIGGTSLGTWAYSQVDPFGINSTLKLVSSLSGASDPSGLADPVIVLRREARLSVNLSPDNSFTIDDYRFDTTYGSTARFNTLRFGSTITPYIDGSAVVTSSAPPSPPGSGLVFTTGALKASYSLATSEIARVDGSLGGTISFPVAPSDNDRVGVVDLYSGFPAFYSWDVVAGGGGEGVQSPISGAFSGFPFSLSESLHRLMFVWQFSADENNWILRSRINLASSAVAGPTFETRASSFVSTGGNVDTDVGATIYDRGPGFTTFDTVSVKVQGCVNTYTAPSGAVTAHWINIEQTWTVGAPNAVIRTILDDQTALPGAEGHVSLGITGSNLFVRVNDGASGTRTIDTNVAVLIISCQGTVPA